MKCPVCGKEFKSFRSFKSHFAYCRQFLKECPVCKRKYKSLAHHFRRHAHRSPIHALLYDITSTHSSRKRHYLETHPEVKRNLERAICMYFER